MQPLPLPKKFLFVLFCFIICSVAVSAQDWTVPNPRWTHYYVGPGNLDEDRARENKAISFTNNNDSTLTVDTLFEGKIVRVGVFPRLTNRRTIEVTKTLVVDGFEVKKIRILFKADGTSYHSTTETYKNNADVVLMEETKTYEKGEIIRGSKIERNAAGAVIQRYRYNPETKTFEIAMTDCSPTNEFFAGYSNLTKLGENESENLVLGLHLAYAYFLSQRMALAADFSMHTKKDNDLRIMQIFLMGGLQYQLILRQNQSKMNALARVLAGVAIDRQKYSSGSYSSTDKASAFAIAFGLGLNYELNRRIAIGILADYIRTQFNDEGQGNIRASAGVRINLGCK